MKMVIAKVTRKTIKGIPTFRMGDRDLEESSGFPNWLERILLEIPLIAVITRPTTTIILGEIVIPWTG